MCADASTTIVVVSAVFLGIPGIVRPESVPPRRHYYARYITELKELAYFELEVGQDLTQVYLGTDLLEKDVQLKQSVESYLLDFYETTGFAHVKDVFVAKKTEVFHNPICSYRLIRRVKAFLRDLSYRPSFLRIFGDLSQKILFFFWKNGWPNAKDFNDAIDSIQKIQEVYDFDLHQFSNGIFMNVKTSCKLDSASSYEIALFYTKTKDTASAIQWLEFTKEKATVDKRTSVVAIEFSLRKAIARHNREFLEDALMDFPPTSFDRPIKYFPGDIKSATKIRTLQYKAYKSRKISGHKNVKYWALCSGENLQTKEEKSQLFCWHEFKRHPSFQVGPMKMEFLARNPDVVRIYNILNDKEMEALKEIGSSLMLPSFVQWSKWAKSSEKAHSDQATQDPRKSMVHLANDSLDLSLARKVAHVTGLHVLEPESSERLNIASYTFGGVFKPHMDELLQPLARSGVRIATVLFYFNEVEMGGKTAFPYLGFAVTPVKGSAAFWHNLNLAGIPDEMTTHAACPVVIGEKWIANKWTHARNQFLVRQCSLNRKERIRIPVNSLFNTPRLHKLN